MTDAPVFKVEHVAFGYNNRLVLKDISCDIERGEFVGIIGPNGSGKSTLVKLLVGILRPKSGSIQVFGEPLETFKEWPRIGYVSQRATHFDVGFPATVREVVSLGRVSRVGLFRRRQKADEEAIDRALEDVGMVDMQARLIGNLSGGQQQRVFIARALTQQPEVLALDEPTIGVDPEAHLKFFELMRHLHDHENLTIVLVSHEVDVVMTEVTKLLCVNQELLFHGTPQQCLTDNCLVQLYGEGYHVVSHSHPWTHK
ncbi:MAG: metal ABC transporter ATP-binding protein [Chloroflexi bacterium]|nr:metal ABC transporter ATP-binding protein [Chloroflexota bacterium]